MKSDRTQNLHGWCRVTPEFLIAGFVRLLTVTTAPPLTPTTVPHDLLDKQTTDTLRPIFIVIVVFIGLSAIVEEIGRKSRKQKRRNPRRQKPRKQARRRTSSGKNARSQPAITHRPDQETGGSFPNETTPPESADSRQMWGRTAGASAAARSAELERERARWAAGSTGEQRVASELDQLPAEAWWVFHDIPRGASGTNIDHLVIGVGGVFTVNTKNMAGNVWVAERTLMVNGAKTDYLPIAVSEARDTSRRLSTAVGRPIEVNPLLVFLQPATVKAMPDDVTVLHLGNVREWLQSRPMILTAHEAYDVVLAANQPTTWT